MSTGWPPPDVVASVVVPRPPDQVWPAVADPRRIAAWSPEARAVRAAAGVGAPMPVGSVFSGSNRHGVFRWSTRCVVVESTPGEAFAFEVSYLGMDVARWRYSLTSIETGTRVDEQWWDIRGPVMKVVGLVGTGVRDRRQHNERTMRETLDALALDLGES